MAEPPTYQELIATNRQLLAENEQFREENAKLSILVKSTPEAGEETKKIEVILVIKFLSLYLRKRSNWLIFVPVTILIVYNITCNFNCKDANNLSKIAIVAIIY